MVPHIKKIPETKENGGMESKISPMADLLFFQGFRAESDTRICADNFTKCKFDLRKTYLLQ